MDRVVGYVWQLTDGTVVVLEQKSGVCQKMRQGLFSWRYQGRSVGSVSFISRIRHYLFRFLELI